MRNVNDFAILAHIGFKSKIGTWQSHLELICEQWLHTLPDTKVKVAKDHAKNCT